MRNVLMWLGIFGVCAIALMIIGIGFAAYKGTRLDREAHAYATGAVRAVTSHWDVSELTARESDKFKSSVEPTQLTSLFNWFSVLGPLVQLQDCKGGSVMNAVLGKATVISAHYVCGALYQAGKASIELGLVKEGADWRVNGFRVNSPALLAHVPGQKT